MKTLVHKISKLDWRFEFDAWNEWCNAMWELTSDFMYLQVGEYYMQEALFGKI